MHMVFLIVIISKMVIKTIGLKELPVEEPDYQQLLYGSIWRHTIYSPEESGEILKAKKYLKDFLVKHHPELASTESQLRCISHHVLWYTATDWSPLVLDSYVQDKKGHKYPVSIPVSLGSTFNFLLAVSNGKISTIHAFTITESTEHNFYLYSSIFYSVADHQTIHRETGCVCNCERQKSSTALVLSMLALSKFSELYSENSCILKGKSKNIQYTYNEKLNISHEGIGQSAPQSPVKAIKTEGAGGLMKTVSVMTYNIWNFNAYQGSSSHHDQYVERFERILQLLQKTQPDIAGFQEVRYEQASGGKLGPNQVDHLISALPGYQFVYQPAQMMPDSFQRGRAEEGVAIFSKYPIVHHEYLFLFRNRHNSADQHQRICLHAVIYVPFIGKVHIFNTHLSLSHEAREESVSQIIQFMKESGEDEPALLMGDLNASPEEKAIRMLSEDSDFEDVWNKLHLSRGFTFNNLEDELSKRIDYIFLKKLTSMTALKVEVLPDGIKSRAASDHRPVLATLGFKT